MTESIASSIQVLSLDDGQHPESDEEAGNAALTLLNGGDQTPRRNSVSDLNTGTEASSQSLNAIDKRVDEIESRVKTLEQKATFRSRVNYSLLEAGGLVRIGNVWHNEMREWHVEVQKCEDSVNFRVIVDGVECLTCLRATFNLTITSNNKLIAELKNQLLVINSSWKTYEHGLSWCHFVNARNEYLRKEADEVFVADFDVKIHLQSTHLFGIEEDPRQLRREIEKLKGVIAAQREEIELVKRKDVITLEFSPSKADFEGNFRSEPVEWEGLQWRLRASPRSGYTNQWGIWLVVLGADTKPCSANFIASYTARYEWKAGKKLKEETEQFKRVGNESSLLSIASVKDSQSFFLFEKSRLDYKVELKIHSVHSA